MFDLIAKKSALPVSRGALPHYIHFEDFKTNTSDTIEVASVLYEGAVKFSNALCLEHPQPEVPITGTTTNTEPEEIIPKPIEDPKPKDPSWFEKIIKKTSDGISEFFGGKEDDSDPLND